MRSETDRQASCPGFTLVELMVAMVAGSVLAVTAGSLLYYGYTAWRLANTAVAMQRDGTQAMRFMGKRLRAASAPLVMVNGSQLTIVRQGTTTVFRAVGEDLLYDPDATAVGDEQVVVDGCLVRFAPVLHPEGVRVRLQLSTGDEAMQFDSIVGFRNE